MSYDAAATLSACTISFSVYIFNFSPFFLFSLISCFLLPLAFFLCLALFPLSSFLLSLFSFPTLPFSFHFSLSPYPHRPSPVRRFPLSPAHPTLHFHTHPLILLLVVLIPPLKLLLFFLLLFFLVLTLVMILLFLVPSLVLLLLLFLLLSRPLRSLTCSFPNVLHSCFTCVPLSLRLSFSVLPLSLFLIFLSPRLVPDPDLNRLVLAS